MKILIAQSSLAQGRLNTPKQKVTPNQLVMLFLTHGRLPFGCSIKTPVVPQRALWAGEKWTIGSEKDDFHTSNFDFVLHLPRRVRRTGRRGSGASTGPSVGRGESSDAGGSNSSGRHNHGDLLGAAVRGSRQKATAGGRCSSGGAPYVPQSHRAKTWRASPTK